MPSCKGCARGEVQTQALTAVKVSPGRRRCLRWGPLAPHPGWFLPGCGVSPVLGAGLEARACQRRRWRPSAPASSVPSCLCLPCTFAARQCRTHEPNMEHQLVDAVTLTADKAMLQDFVVSSHETRYRSINVKHRAWGLETQGRSRADHCSHQRWVAGVGPAEGFAAEPAAVPLPDGPLDGDPLLPLELEQLRCLSSGVAWRACRASPSSTGMLAHRASA